MSLETMSGKGVSCGRQAYACSGENAENLSVSVLVTSDYAGENVCGKHNTSSCTCP